MKMSRAEMANCIIYQIGALKGFLDAEGMSLNHIKPHGSLYGMAGRLEHIGNAICDAADVFKVPILGMIGTLHESLYPARGHAFISEYYSDLDYDDNGNLIVTQEHDPVDAQTAASNCVRAIREGKTTSIGGTEIKVRADSICVHSDTPNSVEIAQAVRGAIEPFMSA